MPASAARSLWPRRLLVAALVALLLGLGLFEAEVFAALGHLWHPGGAPAAVPGITTHGLPVAISYRLLYAMLNVALLHLLLHGRYTVAAVVAYAVGYVAGAGLLWLGQRAGLPIASLTGHRVLDVLSSPLPVMFAYPLALLAGPKAPAHPAP
ncbi:XrtX-associated membrane protein [Hymenobacter sp. PAMC 26628]|uniref:XrtX-associated membrane protein n=1 Tax=Hymenobacter sp. PAMC 26628 TaxID=1484118 RepID=UPI00077013E6|nr:hypothetical protein [Hymenobacter sp. PAMC 26628]AMJ65623.1 hypothetical protein AXW84_09410 [Hymenobacter sp. PAMC 26628]